MEKKEKEFKVTKKKELEDIIKNNRKEILWSFFTSSWGNIIFYNPFCGIYTTFTILVRYFKIINSNLEKSI